MLHKLLAICICLSSKLVVACEIAVFGNDNKYPKVYAEQSQPKGILVDMIKYIEQEIDCVFTFRLMPWKRAYASMLEGKGIIIGLSKTADRLQYLEYSDAMFVEEIRLVSRTDTPLNFFEINDLKAMTVAFNRGSRYGDKFSQALENQIFIPKPDNGDMKNRLKMILLGRVDVGVFGPGTAMIEKAKKEDSYIYENKHNLKIHQIPLKQDPNFIGYKKGLYSNEFLDAINKAIKKGKQNGTFKTIETYYLTK